jgi:hypothetical protein
MIASTAAFKTLFMAVTSASVMLCASLSLIRATPVSHASNR